MLLELRICQSSRPTLLTPRDHAALRARPGARTSHDELSNSTRAPLLLR
jgi:hypothetical protein